MVKSFVDGTRNGGVHKIYQELYNVISTIIAGGIFPGVNNLVRERNFKRNNDKNNSGGGGGALGDGCASSVLYPTLFDVAVPGASEV